MAAKRGPGAPSRLTPEVQERIVNAARINYLSEAALIGGVTAETVYQWLNVARKARWNKTRPPHRARAALRRVR